MYAHATKTILECMGRREHYRREFFSHTLGRMHERTIKGEIRRKNIRKMRIVDGIIVLWRNKSHSTRRKKIFFFLLLLKCKEKSNHSIEHWEVEEYLLGEETIPCKTGGWRWFSLGSLDSLGGGLLLGFLVRRFI